MKDGSGILLLLGILMLVVVTWIMNPRVRGVSCSDNQALSVYVKCTTSDYGMKCREVVRDLCGTTDK